ncbi:uncharacterized protein [Aristolochia californica]|uniref:uncharacterized protein n=1 Tax=Aristolochia californica TaxID=171875 RepID=UPI0035E024E5
MACLDTFNMDHQSFCSTMSPRISFSSDFVDPDQKIKHERLAAPPPDASNFEFSVSNYSMIAADEIFFKGRILPLKKNCTKKLQKMTLRDELCNDDDGGDDGISPRPPKGPTRWKELLGLRKTHAVGKKHEKIDGSVERIDGRKSTLCPSETHLNKISQLQEVLTNEDED